MLHSVPMFHGSSPHHIHVRRYILVSFYWEVFQFACHCSVLCDFQRPPLLWLLADFWLLSCGVTLEGVFYHVQPPTLPVPSGHNRRSSIICLLSFLLWGNSGQKVGKGCLPHSADIGHKSVSSLCLYPIPCLDSLCPGCITGVVSSLIHVFS